MKLYHKVVYENSSDEFDIGHCRIKVKVMARLWNFSPFTTIQTVKSYISALAQVRELWLSMSVNQIILYKIYKYRHTWMILQTVRDVSMLKLLSFISQLWLMLGSYNSAVMSSMPSITKLFRYRYAWVILCNVGEVIIFEHGHYISVLEHIRMVIFSSYVLLACINKIINIATLEWFSEMYINFQFLGQSSSICQVWNVLGRYHSAVLFLFKA